MHSNCANISASEMLEQYTLIGFDCQHIFRNFAAENIHKIAHIFSGSMNGIRLPLVPGVGPGRL